MKVGYHHLGILSDTEKSAPSANCLQCMIAGQLTLFPNFNYDKRDHLFDNTNKLREQGIEKFVCHGPYTQSFSESAAYTTAKSITEYLQLLYECRFDYYILHSSSVDNLEYMIASLAMARQMLIDNGHEEAFNLLCIENKANKSSLDQKSLEDVAKDLKVNLCLDTAHLWASGHDLPSSENKDLYKVVHFNAAARERGDGLDKHSMFSIDEDHQEFLLSIMELFNDGPLYITERHPDYAEHEIQHMLKLYSQI